LTEFIERIHRGGVLEGKDLKKISLSGRKIMKRFLLSTVFFMITVFYFVPVTLMCASNSEKPETVYSIVYVQKSDEWYHTQENLWKKEIQKNPKNEEAWRNYYYAARYKSYVDSNSTPQRKNKLDHIMQEMGKAIPNTYEYYYLMNKNSQSIINIDYIQKAYEINPDRPELYSDFVGHYEFTGNEGKMKYFLQKWYNSKDLAPGLLNYNYNVLMSAGESAILFTNGDNDTYPVWMLQLVREIRTDVTIINTSLMMADQKYLNRKLKTKGVEVDYSRLPKYRTPEFVSALGTYISQQYPQIPVCFAVTLYSQYTAPIKDKLYIVGLVYQYSPERIDNIAMVKKNLEGDFRLDNLKYDWYEDTYLANGIVDRLNLNYLAPMIILGEHYYKSEEKEKSKYWINFALMLADRGGMRSRLVKDLENKGIKP
jgi:hypothetical protein